MKYYYWTDNIEKTKNKNQYLGNWLCRIYLDYKNYDFSLTKSLHGKQWYTSGMTSLPFDLPSKCVFHWDDLDNAKTYINNILNVLGFSEINDLQINLL